MRPPAKLVLLFMLNAVAIQAQDYNQTVLLSSGPPGGACIARKLDIDITNDNLYFCSNGGWIKTVSGGGSGAPVLLVPTGDQTITGAHALIISGGAFKISGAGSVSDASSNSTNLDIETTSTFATALKFYRTLNLASTWSPSGSAYIGQGLNIDFETSGANSQNVASIVGLSVLSAHNGSGTTSYLEGAVYDTYLQGSGLATGGILAATYSVENDATTAGAIPWTHALDVQSGVGGLSTTTLDATNYIYSPITHSGVMTHHYGLYLEDQTNGGGTINPDPWAIYSAGGNSHFAGALDAGRLRVAVIHTAALVTCNSDAEGSTQAVDDSDTQVWGAPVVHTVGALHALAYCDGTNWTVAAK